MLVMMLFLFINGILYNYDYIYIYIRRTVAQIFLSMYVWCDIGGRCVCVYVVAIFVFPPVAK